MTPSSWEDHALHHSRGDPPLRRLTFRAIRPWLRIESATVFSLTVQPSSRRSWTSRGEPGSFTLLVEHHPHRPVDGVAAPDR